MKKLLMFLCCAFAINTVWAGCTILECERNGDIINGYVKANPGSQCWWCGPGPRSCGNNDIVSYKDEVGDVIGLYKCTIGFSNKFSSFNTGTFCKDSPIKVTTDPNSKITYSTTNANATHRTEFGDLWFNDGSISCMYVKCKNGYRAVGDKCVLIKESECINGGGKWTGTGCDCSHKGKYEWSDSKKKCVLNAEGVKDQEDANRKKRDEQRKREEQENKKAKCVNSGGDGLKNNECVCDKEKNLVTSDQRDECVCISNDYKRSGLVCVEKDEFVRRKKCDNAPDPSAVRWNPNSNECECIDLDLVLTSKYTCVEDPRAVKCKAAKEEADWIGGKCVCKKANYVWNGNKCEEDPQSIRDREEAERRAKIEAAKATITKTVKSLDDSVATLKVTVWKTAEGEFNVARLASDSIAGVVLGTAGGLITSHLVKKGQIKNGFEDIQCTIGGQKVADWGDEFTVGIR